MAFNTLNRIKWTGTLDRCEVVILHRGVEGDRKIIQGSDITELKRSYFCYKKWGGRETCIPLHRVLEIRIEGKAIWKSKKEYGR